MQKEAQSRAWELEFKKQVDCKKNKGRGSEYWELYCVEVSLAKKRSVEWLLVYQDYSSVAVTRWKPVFGPSQVRCQILNSRKDFPPRMRATVENCLHLLFTSVDRCQLIFTEGHFPQGHVYVCRWPPFFWITNLEHVKGTIYGKLLWSPVRLISSGVRWNERQLWNYHGLGSQDFVEILGNHGIPPFYSTPAVCKPDFSFRANRYLPAHPEAMVWRGFSQTFVLITEIYIKMLPHRRSLLTVVTDK